MARLRQFPEHRYVGTRDEMVVYDCDDPAELAALQQRVDRDDVVGRKLVQSFAPDTLPEARNRGFKPVG